MNKPNTGIAKSCPICKKTVLRAGNFQGSGSFQTKCPHCKALILVEINPKPFLTIKSILVIGFLVFITLAISAKIQANRSKLTCGSFTTWPDANKAYLSGATQLDKDGNKIPCESLLPANER